jgi:predicted ATPase
MKGGTRLSPGDIGTRGDRLAGFLAALDVDQRSRVVSRVGLFYPLNELETVRKRAGWIDLILSERFANFGAVPATQMSDGFMRLLALCAVPELPNVSMVLLDELEDGIEPHILGRLVTLVASETRAQIIATSHSPILANVVGASGLRLISRTAEGRAVAVEVGALPAFQIGSQYLGPGELWANTDINLLQTEALDVASSGGEATPDKP